MNHVTTTSTGSDRTAGGRGAPERGRFRNALALSGLGVAAVVLAACGASSSASAPPTSTSGAGGTSSGATTPRNPGTSGTIAAITGTSLEVQSPTTGQTTVSYTSATTFRQITPTTVSAVTVGSCISAFGTPTSGSASTASRFGGPVTATTVSVSQPVAGTCSGGFGRSGGGTPPGGTPGTGSRPAGSGGFGGGRFAGGSFAAASGSVTAVNGSTVSVSETNPTTKATSSVVVTLTATTAFTTTGTASPTDLVVGKCARAVGPADGTGAVTATSLTISTPGANGCTSGFGGFRGGAGGPGAGA